MPAPPSQTTSRLVGLTLLVVTVAWAAALLSLGVWLVSMVL